MAAQPMALPLQRLMMSTMRSSSAAEASPLPAQSPPQTAPAGEARGPRTVAAHAIISTTQLGNFSNSPPSLVRPEDRRPPFLGGRRRSPRLPTGQIDREYEIQPVDNPRPKRLSIKNLVN